jgi:hypothetical protein
MPWESITPARAILTEKQLQEVFNKWPRHGWAVAGAPRWLATADSPRDSEQFEPELGEAFRPDVIFQTDARDYVVELKHASKGEPLALAQTLYYVHMLKTDPAVRRAYGRNAPISGVMITQQSFWLRAALAELTDGRRTPSVQLLEFDTFTHAGRKIIWFCDPFADWAAATNVPSELADKFREKFWYFVESEETWIGMPAPCKRRQHLFTERHVVASRSRTSQRELGLIAWEGSYTDSVCSYEIFLPERE